MPKLLDIISFCDDLKEVTSSKIIDKRKFYKDGLFSEQIFGPIKNYTCQCGTYHGISRTGTSCSVCGVDIVNSDVRRKRFAKIVLPIQIVNPIMYDLIVDIGGNLVKTYLNKLMKNEKSVLYLQTTETDSYYLVTDSDKVPDGVEKWERLEAIYELISNTSTEEVENDPNSKWKIIKNNLDKLFIQTILVLPPDLRPAAKGVERNNQIVDKINRFYMQILTKKESMRDTIIDIARDKTLFYSYFKQLQKDANELYEHIIEKLSKKEGLIRGNILGKRIDFSGRAVIIPDPSLKIDECSLPYVMFLELFKLKISKKLIELSRFKLLNDAIDFVDNCIEFKDFSIFNICEELAINELCILNRQPTLHRLGMLGFKIKISMDNVIKIHPLACSGFNADFDGDQMAVYIPISEQSKQEILDKVIITKNFTSPSDMSLSSIPSQDIVLGIYTLSTNQFPNLKNIVTYKNENIFESIKILNDCFPEDYKLINFPIGKKELVKILNDIKDNYSELETAKTLDKIKEVGFKYSTLFGPSLSLGSFIVKGSSKLRDLIYKDGTPIEQIKRLSSSETQSYLKENFKYSYLIESGARGSWEQARQIVLSRGYVSDFNGMIKETPIKNSLLNGLNQEEFFNSTYGCRKGLLDVALNTGASGYLSRKLIFTGTNLELSETLEDCQTTDYLDVFVENEKKSKMLTNRFFLNSNNVIEKITKDNRKELIGKTIKLRSPIFCKSEELCHTCYGDYKDLHSKFVGVIAAQCLGETNTQLILRVFHNSLRKDTRVSDVNGKSYTIEEVYNLVKSGNDFYTFSCSPEGKIVVSKVIDAHKDRFENKMIRVTLDNDEIIETTLEHEFIMRDGSCKKAQDLEISDSLMPLYWGEEVSCYEGYSTIIQNIISPWHKKGRKTLVFHLSGEHNDSIKHESLDYSKKIVKHHIDKNIENNYPTNIMIINENEHLKEHVVDSVNSPNRSNTRKAVSESNIRRTKDPSWVENFNIKRNETLSVTYPSGKNSEEKKKWHEENPEMRFHCTKEARLTTAKIILNKIMELNLEPTNINYENVRMSFGTRGKHFLTFGFVKENYPELVQNFNIIAIEKKYKSSNQLQAEYRVNLILNKIKELNLELNEKNFDDMNQQIYPDSRSRWKRTALTKFSPDCLSILKNNHKVIKIEIIDLPDYEEFFDLTVDSEHQNFALSSGIFIHNSGIAKLGKNNSKEDDNGDSKQKDIVGDLTLASRLFHQLKDKNYKDLVEDSYQIYNNSRDIHYVHFECLISQMMWGKDNGEENLWRLLPEREKKVPVYYSIQTVPEKSSWILGLGFSNPKRQIIKGIQKSGKYKGIFDRIICGENL